jgi:hypothetical protein
VSRSVRWLVSAVVLVATVAVGVGLAVATGDRPQRNAEGATTGTPTSSQPTTTDAVDECPDPPVVAGVDPRVLLPAEGVYLGASVPEGPLNPAGLDDFDLAAGRQVALVNWFLDWTTAFPTEGVELTVERGAIPVLSWDPTVSTGAENVTDQPEYRLANIVNGAFDGYIRTFATEARDSCQVVVLRFASEMNGNWHPWSELANGNQSGEFVQAWRHVHDIFTAVGATNVAWFWGPNVYYQGAIPLAGLYPGDAYVDWVGLSGYNWGTVNSWNRWQSFAQIFDRSLADLAQLTAKPVLIGEIASAEEGGDKAAWITNMFAELLARPQIRGFIWFEYVKETDWRIVSSPEAQGAFASGASQSFVLGGPVAS